MASHQSLLSGEVGVKTPATAYDKSDEALVKVVLQFQTFRYKRGGRWTETERGAAGRRDGDKDPTDLGERRGEGERKLMASICLGMPGERGSKQTYDFQIAAWHGKRDWLDMSEAVGRGSEREANDPCSSVRELI